MICTENGSHLYIYIYVCVCVCVCHPLGKGFTVSPTSTGIPRRGQQGIHSSAANEERCGHSVKQIGTPICVPAKKLLITLSNFLFLFSMVVHDTPTNHFPSAAFSCRALSRVCRCAQPFVATSSIDRTHHPAVEPFLSSGN